MIVRIASTRRPKIDGVQRGIRRAAEQFGIDHASFRFESTEAVSGVADTPMSVEESMRGAHERARSIFGSDRSNGLLTVGVEGGLFRAEGKIFLQSWVCIYDGTEFHFGSSGSIELPSELGRAVTEEGMQLADAIDRLANDIGVRNKQGTFGILTDDLFTREDSFAQATLLAAVPLFHRSLYGRRP